MGGYDDDLRLALVIADMVDSHTMSRFQAVDLAVETKPDLTPVSDADRAAEEDIKEEMLLYCVLAKERVHVDELPDVDRAIEQYLANTFGINVNFDLDDAMERLKADHLVTIGADGFIVTLVPQEAAGKIDEMWDVYLDHLPDPAAAEGHEMDAEGL